MILLAALDDPTTIFTWSNLTPVALSLSAIALVITSFARGWIVSKFVVEMLVAAANQRGEDYKALYETEKQRADVLQGIVEQLTELGTTSAKILEALPRTGGSS